MLTFCYSVLCFITGLWTGSGLGCGSSNVYGFLKFVGWIRFGRIMFRSVKIERWLTYSAYGVGLAYRFCVCGCGRFARTVRECAERRRRRRGLVRGAPVRIRIQRPLPRWIHCCCYLRGCFPPRVLNYNIIMRCIGMLSKVWFRWIFLKSLLKKGFLKENRILYKDLYVMKGSSWKNLIGMHRTVHVINSFLEERELKWKREKGSVTLGYRIRYRLGMAPLSFLISAAAVALRVRRSFI